MPGSPPIHNLRPIARFGSDDRAVVAENLRAVRVEETLAGLSSLELHLANVTEDDPPELAFDTDELVYLGASVEVGFGEEESPTLVFKGKVSGLEALFGDGTPVLVVLAEDALLRARMTRRTKVYDAFSVRSFVDELVRPLGLQARCEGYDGTYGRQVQLNESDLAFLRRILARLDGAIQVVAGELHVRPIDRIERGTLQLDAQSDFHALRITADLAHQANKVTHAGWDAQQGSAFHVDGNAAQLTPGSGTSGGAAVQGAFFARGEHVGHVVVADRGEATALAQAEQAARARGFVRLHGTLIGSPAVVVGARIELSGAGDRFSNTYRVVRTCHRFDLVEGYRVDVDAECPWLGRPGR